MRRGIGADHRRGASSRCVLASLALFTVDQRQNAIVFQLGEVKDVITEPGLHFEVAAARRTCAISTCAS